MFYAISCFLLWGLFPLYFKLLQDVSSFDIVVQRIFWSLLFLIVVLTWKRQWAWLGDVVRKPRVLLGFLVSALLLSGNWVLYVWAVNSGRIVDSSLGYFMSPLISVLLGYVILKERLRPLQWLSVFMALGAVLWLTWVNGALPWIGLVIAATFGIYGLLRKIAHLGALEGLALETILLAPLVLTILAVTAAHGNNGFLQASPTSQILMALSGPVTAIPLLLFARAARRIPLSLLGLLQYISPTMQLLTGVFIYDEPFDGPRLTGFVVIWTALAVYSVEGLWRLWSAKGRALSA
ncbi:MULTISPECIES: EamA family transporter RarD [unclassified Herbaspirillum]|uniref:EamA family transporter RarD n=1 Tax=unclassified Herbaspirillum TaxID=2624150 RepID=UPI000E2F0AE6|nr:MULTISPECIES: EamA family transporter RarD [unclassified Herbaspirillum]RFB68124.1 EamA family transporter RarD [Herbaspirillum sp. 3R-3a1]TFI06570.1 EamA family transporter RarD [Herbaspirillum sp. 3R11]TFI13818.1 EamA family transporter RarD [Herbaspirillum sp. 3R-11]TFI29262.1 EamA family transporter RarD [Herbaspirillum sp. 3C11]